MNTFPSLIHFFSIFPRENNVFFFEIEKKKRILFVTVIPRAISKMSRSSTTSSSTSSSSLSESEEDEAESLVKAAVAATAKVFYYVYLFILSFFLPRGFIITSLISTLTHFSFFSSG